MWFEGSLSGLSVWLTYCVQVAFAFLTTWCICALIQHPRIRVRLWGCFLFLATATWLLLWIPPSARNPVLSFHSATLPAASKLHLAVPVKSVWISHVANLASAAWRIYAFLLLVTLLHFLFKSVQLRTVLRRSQPTSAELQSLFQDLCEEFEIKRSELALLPGLRSPATCFWLRSHVFLPAELVPQLDSDQLADVLRHELIHVKQHDYFWDRLAALGCRLVFFHPLVWMAYRRLRWERELACDRAVVEKRTEARLSYAECLTRLARWFGEENSISEGIGFSSSESLLARRVRALLSEPSSHSKFQKTVRFALVVIVSVGAVFLVPSLGLRLYSPVPLADLFVRTRAATMDSDHKKKPQRKARRDSPAKVPNRDSLAMLPQAESPLPINLFLNSESAPLPVLRDSSASADDGEGSTYSKRISDVRPNVSHPVWHEAPMTLAKTPRWQKVVVGAITDGLAVASGRLDGDEDGTRKRGR